MMPLRGDYQNYRERNKSFILESICRALEVLKPLTAELDNVANKSINSASENDSENGDESLINSDIKSPISIVHEMALKRKLSVTFEVQSEKGPPHMKVYTTLCQVGSIVVRKSLLSVLQHTVNRFFVFRLKVKAMVKSCQRKKQPRK